MITTGTYYVALQDKILSTNAVSSPTQDSFFFWVRKSITLLLLT